MLPIAYVASLGPACWVVSDNLEPISAAYYPILWLGRVTWLKTEPGIVNDFIEWYSTLGRSDGAWPGLLSNGERVWFVPPDPVDVDPETGLTP